MWYNIKVKCGEWYFVYALRNLRIDGERQASKGVLRKAKKFLTNKENCGIITNVKWRRK